MILTNNKHLFSLPALWNTATLKVAFVLLLTLLSMSKGTLADTISDNLDRETAFTELISGTTWITAGFQSGPTTSTLTEVTLLLRAIGTGLPSLYLYTDIGSAPGVRVGTLVSPNLISTQLSETMFGGAGLMLTPNTNYWLVTSAARGVFEWAYTDDNTGVGVGFRHTWGYSDDSGRSWSTADTSPMQMRITATPLTAVPEPRLPLLILVGFAFLILMRGDLLALADKYRAE